MHEKYGTITVTKNQDGTYQVAYNYQANKLAMTECEKNVAVDMMKRLYSTTNVIEK